MKPECNPYLRKSSERHVNSCEYSRIALAVWHTDADKFAQFHQWMMQGETPPSLGRVMFYVENDLKLENIREVAKSEEVRRSLSRMLTLYQKCGRGIVPKLFVRGRQIVGAPSREDDAKMVTAIQGILGGR